MKKLTLLSFILLQLNFSSSLTTQKYYSERDQDQFVIHTFFPNKINGFFVDIGAFDGITQSNSLAFEKRGWQGICFEPTPSTFQKLKEIRNCICIQGCVSDTENSTKFLRVIGGETFNGVRGAEMLNGILDNYDQRHLNNVMQLAQQQQFQTEIIEVPCYLFNKILDAYHTYHIDLLCIDIESGELKVLKSIDWERFTIDVVIVEELFPDSGIKEFLESKGFVRIKSIQPDVIYRNKKYLNSESIN